MGRGHISCDSEQLADASMKRCTSAVRAPAGVAVAGPSGLLRSSSRTSWLVSELGVWRRREVVTTPNRKSMPTFHEYASVWLQSKIAGVLGDRPIDTNTEADYRWRLARHLLPFFGGYRLDEIDADLCLAFKAHKLREAADLRSAIAAGAILREPNGTSPAAAGTVMDQEADRLSRCRPR